MRIIPSLKRTLSRFSSAVSPHRARPTKVAGRSIGFRRRALAGGAVVALALSAPVTAAGAAHATASMSAPIIGTMYNSSARSNCAYPGLSGVAYLGVTFPPAAATGTTHFVGSTEQGIFLELIYTENSATKVDYLNDCINGDWYYAFTAAYPGSYVHRTIAQQYLCNGGGCWLAGIIYSGWTSGWAGTARP
jgi:hypothetical protein